MPQSSIIITNPGVDSWGGTGQLIEDSGVVTDMEGGFDVATLVVLYPESAALPGITGKDKHPDYDNLFLFGVSPRRVAGGARQVTLTYKGVAGRVLGKGGVPTLNDPAAKLSWGIRMTERAAAMGEIEGTVDGVNLAGVAVNIMQPQRTLRINWMDTKPIPESTFNIPNGRASTSFGAIDENFYSTIQNPVYNYPHGWVPIEASSDQAYPGIDIWANSITYVGIPKFSAG